MMTRSMKANQRIILDKWFLRFKFYYVSILRLSVNFEEEAVIIARDKGEAHFRIWVWYFLELSKKSVFSHFK